jgi:hypothetical protein
LKGSFSSIDAVSNGSDGRSGKLGREARKWSREAEMEPMFAYEGLMIEKGDKMTEQMALIRGSTPVLA